MSQLVIKQPNGLYALFSTMSETFVMQDATPQQIKSHLIDYRCESCRKTVTNEVTNIISILDKGGKPYYRFTISWEKAYALHKKHTQINTEIKQ